MCVKIVWIYVNFKFVDDDEIYHSRLLWTVRMSGCIDCERRSHALVVWVAECSICILLGWRVVCDV